MKKTLILALVLILVACMFTACGGSTPAPAPAPADDSSSDEGSDSTVSASLTMGTGGESGTYYAFGGVLASVIGENSDIDITVVSTGGSKDNIVSMDNGIYQLATVQSDVMTYAYEGTNSFEESGKIDSFNVIGGLYAETVQIVTVDPSIRTVSDLKGKTVCIGDVGSGTYYNTVDVLAAYDMTIDDIKPVYQSFGDSTESLKDGKIDAAFLCAGAPTPAVTDLAASKEIYLVSFDDEHMAKLLAATPYYASYVIPAGTYASFNEDCMTVTVKATLICSANTSEEVGYELAKQIWDNTEAIKALHGKGNELDYTFATEGIVVPFNAGAAKFFAEKGIDVAK